jgi:hypothetical protein
MSVIGNDPELKDQTRPGFGGVCSQGESAAAVTEKSFV